MIVPYRQGPLLTLEPLVEAVREGLEKAGWSLSGLQKTTSYEFEGRWAGESSRSAYLFFHRDDVPDWASIEGFLDETGRGLRGNLALVVDGKELAHLPETSKLLASLASLAAPHVPKGHRLPLSLRFRLSSLEEDPGTSETEIRFKLNLPKQVLEEGYGAVVALVAGAARSFHGILSSPGLGRFVPSKG